MVRRIRKLVAVTGTAAVICLTAACGGSVLPTSPTPVSSTLTTSALSRQVPPTLAVVDGLVQVNRSVDSYPIGGVLVEVFEGGVVTASTISDGNGNFHFELLPGEIQLRGTLAGYGPGGTGPKQIQAGQRTVMTFRITPPSALPPVILSPEPYAAWPLRTVSGRVTDSSGNGIASASVCAVDISVGWGWGCGYTDTTGTYTMSFRMPVERRSNVLRISHAGYPDQQFSFDCCTSPEPVVFNVMMPAIRVVRLALIGPASLRVGEVAQIMADITFEDGSKVTVTPIMLQASIGVANSLRGAGMVEGVRPAPGFLSWSYQHVAASLTIAVTQ